MKHRPALALAALTIINLAASFAVDAQPPAPADATASRQAQVAHGRYLVRISGCNDCHTPGYGAANGKVDEKLWLTGDQLGWSGPWGTTYPTNLRLYMANLSEGDWLRTARKFQPRPPMPWFNVHAMNDRDLRAIYRYIRFLGPAGTAAPAYVPPDQKASGPVVQFPK